MGSVIQILNFDREHRNPWGVKKNLLVGGVS